MILAASKMEFIIPNTPGNFNAAQLDNKKHLKSVNPLGVDDDQY